MIRTGIVLAGVVGCGLCGCAFLTAGLKDAWSRLRTARVCQIRRAVSRASRDPRVIGVLLGVPAGVLAALLTLLCASSLRSGQSSLAEPVNLIAALDRASAAWGRRSPDPVTVRMDAMNACDLSHGRHPQIAETEVVTTRIGDAAPEYSYAIAVNSNCRWTQRWLDDAMAHEYGHVLAGAAHVAEHSADPHSIMYPNVHERGGQRITDADRKRLAIWCR